MKPSTDIKIIITIKEDHVEILLPNADAEVLCRNGLNNVLARLGDDLMLSTGKLVRTSLGKIIIDQYVHNFTTEKSRSIEEKILEKAEKEKVNGEEM